MARIENLIEKFPSDDLLDLLTESDIIRNKAEIVSEHRFRQHRREQYRERHRQVIKNTIEGAIGAQIHLIERDGEVCYEPLSANGGLLFPFSSKFLTNLNVVPQFEDRIVEQLYKELRLLASQVKIVGIRGHVFAFEDGQLVIRPPFPQYVPNVRTMAA